MTMHVVLGDGEMTRKELTETLADIWKADEEAGQTFWFLLQGKSEPTDTDKNMVKWLESNDIYYEIITDDESSVDEIYSAPQETHVAKRLPTKVVALMQEKPEEGETAELLTLFVDNDTPDAEEDRWVNTVASAVYKNEFLVRAMNDGLVDLDLSDEAAAAEEEPDEKPKSVAKKAPTKKAAPSAKAPGRPLSITPPAEEDDTPVSHTREELEDKDIAALKAIAAELGISVPPRSRQGTYIDLILGEDKSAKAAEVTEQEEGESATLNGFDTGAFAAEVATLIVNNVLRALKEAFNEV